MRKWWDRNHLSDYWKRGIGTYLYCLLTFNKKRREGRYATFCNQSSNSTKKKCMAVALMKNYMELWRIYGGTVANPWRNRRESMEEPSRRYSQKPPSPAIFFFIFLAWLDNFESLMTKKIGLKFFFFVFTICLWNECLFLWLKC